MIDYKKDNRITITKGDTMAWKIKFKNITEDLRSAYFTIKENPTDEAIIQKSLGAGIEKIDDRSYKGEKTYKLQLQAEDTVNLSADLQYLYDLKVAVGNVVKTILSGVFIAKESVTGASQIIIDDAEIDATDLLEAEIETTPATNGIEYEQDPVANAKIGDLTALITSAKQTLVDAINEAETQANNTQEDVEKILDGTLVVPEATHAGSADTATTATNANKVGHKLSFGAKTFNGLSDETIYLSDLTTTTWQTNTCQANQPLTKPKKGFIYIYKSTLHIGVFYYDPNAVQQLLPTTSMQGHLYYYEIHDGYLYSYNSNDGLVITDFDYIQITKESI